MMVAAWKGRGPKASTLLPTPTSSAESGASTPLHPLTSGAEISPVPAGDPLPRALGISLLNPKAILYCIAFFIQFVDPAYGHKVVPFVLLGSIAQSMSFLYLSVLIFSGARLADTFRRWRRTRTALTGAAGAAFVGFGAKLATAVVN
jgi:leucine efflux protein